jgi:hypothetical protein
VKIRGKQHFFGVWEKTDDAETEYLRVRDYLQAGRLAPTPGDACVVHRVHGNADRTERREHTGVSADRSGGAQQTVVRQQKVTRGSGCCRPAIGIEGNRGRTSDH